MVLVILVEIMKIRQKKSKTNSIEMDFFTFRAEETFIHLQKAFTKVLILKHFDQECNIQIKTDLSKYVIS